MKHGLLSSLCLATSVAFAIPTPQQEQGGETYTKDMCVQSYRERCINLTCLNSESTSCTQDCERAAKDKCASIHN